MNWQLGHTPWFWAALIAAATLGGASHAQNRVLNPDFEIDADSSGNPDLWFRGGAIGYVSGDDSDGVGTHSVSSMDGGDWRSRAFAVTAGEELQFSFDYKVSPGSTGTFRSDLRFFLGGTVGGETGGVFVGEFAPTTDVATVPQGVWNTAGPFAVIVPDGAIDPTTGDVRLSAGIFGADLVGTVQFDNVRVRVPEPSAILLASICVGGLISTHRRRTS